jgi:hypothetical protein
MSILRFLLTFATACPTKPWRSRGHIQFQISLRGHSTTSFGLPTTPRFRRTRRRTYQQKHIYSSWLLIFLQCIGRHYYQLSCIPVLYSGAINNVLNSVAIVFSCALCALDKSRDSLIPLYTSL